jgi:enterochelin esterase-like enzyme
MKALIWLLLSALFGFPATTDYTAPMSDIPLPSATSAASSAEPSGPAATPSPTVTPSPSPAATPGTPTATPSPKPSASPAAAVGGILKEEVLSTSPDVRKLTFKSNALGKDKRFNIYLPPNYAAGSEAYPVLYMLHGTGGNENQWMPDLGLDKAADKLISENRIHPMIIVTPVFDFSYGINTEIKGAYGDYITKDLVAFVDKHFRTLASRENRYIGGLSMGGFAALNNAFQHPDLYSKVGGHSPALWMEYWADTGDLKDWLYPDEAARKTRDPLSLAETLTFDNLSVFLDSGKNDGYRFYEGSELLYKKLLQKGTDVQYHLWEGEHTKDYWSSHAEDYLLFFGGK